MNARPLLALLATAVSITFVLPPAGADDPVYTACARVDRFLPTVPCEDLPGGEAPVVPATGYVISGAFELLDANSRARCSGLGHAVFAPIEGSTRDWTFDFVATTSCGEYEDHCEGRYFPASDQIYGAPDDALATNGCDKGSALVMVNPVFGTDEHGRPTVWFLRVAVIGHLEKVGDLPGTYVPEEGDRLRGFNWESIVAY